MAATSQTDGAKREIASSSATQVPPAVTAQITSANSKLESAKVEKIDAKKDDTKSDKKDEKTGEKKSDKKDDKKDDKKTSGVQPASTPAKPAVPAGPSLEDLARQQLPTVAEEQAKAKTKVTSPTVSSKTGTETNKKEDALASGRLEDIAAQQRLTQQLQSTQYRVPTGFGPQTAYQSAAVTADPASVYRPSAANAPYTVNAQQHEPPQRGGVVTQYERSELSRTVGQTAAEQLLEERRRQIHGDKGIFDTYHRR